MVPIVTLTAAAVLVLVRLVDVTTADARLEMIKVALAVGAGTGAALTLILARRRQLATEHDAAERRLTELYVKAVEQLGSEQAAVRHGGLYALERVAQDNPNHRQTVVDVICAYLRAPYTPRPNKPSATRTGVHRPLLRSPQRRVAASAIARHHPAAPVQRTSDENQRQQEREVRLTAQRILTRHLRPQDNDGQRLDTYWSAIDLDLTGATLINFGLSACIARTGRFDDAHFTGATSFDKVHFTGDTRFDKAQFTGVARFDKAQFTDAAEFVGAHFTGIAAFNGAQFTDAAHFYGAQFTGAAWFDKAQFTGRAEFAVAHFTSGARFNGAQFTDTARFDDAQFTDFAWFDKAQFTSGASFDKAQFTSGASFDDAQFTRGIPKSLIQLLRSSVAGDPPGQTDSGISQGPPP